MSKKAKPVASPSLDLSEAEAIHPPYRHPESRLTVAWHQDGRAYTATGIPAGDVPKTFKPAATKDAAKAQPPAASEAPAPATK